MSPNMNAFVGVAPPLMTVNPADNVWLYLIGSGGLVALLSFIVKTVMDVWKGRTAGREVREADMKTQRDTAWSERNAERRERLKEEARGNAKDRNVRRVLDYAAKIRRQLLDHGITPAVEEPEMEDPEAAVRSMREH